MQWEEFETDGPNGTKRYGLSKTPGGVFCMSSNGNDLGSGQGLNIYSFQHPEGRTYFKQWYATDQQLASAICELETLKTAILSCVTIKDGIRKKKFLELAHELRNERKAK